MSETVLVTGGTGFVGGHCILQLLQEGYNVRTTIRDLKKEDALRDMLKKLNISEDVLKTKFQVFQADLVSDQGWPEALEGCDYVHHVASPLPLEQPIDEEEIIKPAKEGTLRVIRFSEKAGVKKLVFTSSFAAIGYGHPDEKYLTEKDWAIPEKAPNAYIKSKGLAEKAAWEYLKTSGSNMKFTTINPTAIFGPKLPGGNPATSQIMEKLLDGSMALGCPKFSFGIIDVRDVAKIHLLAMKLDSSDNQRYLLTSRSEECSLLDIANVIRKNVDEEKGKKLPTRELPTILFRFLGLFSPQVKNMLSIIRDKKRYNGQKAKKDFSWEPIDLEKSIMDTVNGLNI